ncbi:hypothetical protein ACMFMF_004317 [Clarireedia jacksonii]
MPGPGIVELKPEGLVANVERPLTQTSLVGETSSYSSTTKVTTSLLRRSIIDECQSLENMSSKCVT